MRDVKGKDNIVEHGNITMLQLCFPHTVDCTIDPRCPPSIAAIEYSPANSKLSGGFVYPGKELFKHV